MRTVNIQEAKTHLSRPVDLAAAGESFVISKSGKPLVQVVPLTPRKAGKPKRLGFMSGQIQVPDDFDSMGRAEIEALSCSR